MRDRALYAAVVAAALVASGVLLAPRLVPRPEAADRTDDPPAEAGAPEQALPPAPIPSATEPPSAAPAAPPPLPAYVHLDPEGATACPGGMVLVDGIYCPFVGHRCTSFLIEERDVCKTYAPEVLCDGAPQHRRYCIDTFEYPNLEGVRPAVMVDFNEAGRACAVEGKRLCSIDEWQFACEGPQMWPYPYGIVRDPTACNIDKPHPMPELAAFSNPWKISDEVDRLDQRVRSGEMPRCISPFGVRDMTGNVDEWADNPQGKRDAKPFRSALKGGYWGPIRARCRPMTSSHNEWFAFYQVGFRCCADALGAAPGSSTAAPSAGARGGRGPRVRKLEAP